MAGPGNELINGEEIDAVISALRSGHLGRYGPDEDPAFDANVYRCEQEIAELCGVRYALAVNSGTSALLCIFAGLGIGDGDEVIVPGFTFVASISSIVYAGAVPVLAEVDSTLNLDPADVERRITRRTKAILAVHMMGSPARLAELKKVADRNGVHLIEDCCQAFGATYQGRAVGTYGVAGAMSFNGFKTLSTGDGGMLITDNEELYHRAFAFHDQGHLPNRKGLEIGNRPMLGLNFRMNELSGAVLRAQLGKLELIRTRLRANKALFTAIVAEVPGIEFRTLPDPEGDLGTVFTVLLPTPEIAAAVAGELGVKVLADSGWHTYNHMDHLLARRTAVPRGCPFHCDCSDHQRPEYAAGMLPQTDALLARAVNASIGVSDANLGTAYGVNVKATAGDVRAKAEHFRDVLRRHLPRTTT